MFIFFHIHIAVVVAVAVVTVYSLIVCSFTFQFLISFMWLPILLTYSCKSFKCLLWNIVQQGNCSCDGVSIDSEDIV